MVAHSEIISRIRKIISDNNLSNSSFADRIGVARSSISHILSGRNNPSLDIIIKILHSFDEINADFLLTGKAASPAATNKSKGSANRNLTLFPELDINESPKEESEINEELVKSVILVYQNNKFEILKNK